MNTLLLSYTLDHTISVLTYEYDQLLLERLGIGYAQYKILAVIMRNEQARQNQIAKALGQTEASISRQIKLLVRDGLLSVHIPPNNKREHSILLTPRGHRFTQEAQQILLSCQQRMTAGLSQKQQDQLQELLDLLHGGICLTGASSSRIHLFGA